jgi:hypothetical protein
MPRRQVSPAAVEKSGALHEAARPSRRQSPNGSPSSTKRLSKRVVPKADGRYLIYYEKRDKA